MRSRVQADERPVRVRVMLKTEPIASILQESWPSRLSEVVLKARQPRLSPKRNGAIRTFEFGPPPGGTWGVLRGSGSPSQKPARETTLRFTTAAQTVLGNWGCFRTQRYGRQTEEITQPRVIACSWISEP